MENYCKNGLIFFLFIKRYKNKNKKSSKPFLFFSKKQIIKHVFCFQFLKSIKLKTILKHIFGVLKKKKVTK